MTSQEYHNMKCLRNKGMTYEEIAKAMGYSKSAIAKNCRNEHETDDYLFKKEVGEFICSDETCGDCEYFGWLNSKSPQKDCCCYTLMTGNARDISKPCAKCAEKKIINR